MAAVTFLPRLPRPSTSPMLLVDLPSPIRGRRDRCHVDVLAVRFVLKTFEDFGVVDFRDIMPMRKKFFFVETEFFPSW